MFAQRQEGWVHVCSETGGVDQGMSYADMHPLFLQTILRINFELFYE